MGKKFSIEDGLNSVTLVGERKQKRGTIRAWLVVLFLSSEEVMLHGIHNRKYDAEKARKKLLKEFEEEDPKFVRRYVVVPIDLEGTLDTCPKDELMVPSLELFGTIEVEEIGSAMQE